MADTSKGEGLEEFTSLRKLKGKKQPKQLVSNNEDATEENSESQSPFEPPRRNKFAGASRSEEFHKEAMKKYARGVDLPSKESLEKVKDRRLRKTLDDARTMALNAARAEMLLVEEPGFLEAEDEKEKTYKVTQEEIYKAVDLQTSRKMFNLSLPELGPYSFDYDLTGRHLAIGGRKGHIAVFDWVRKDLKCEIQVRERISDIKFLHTSNMFAVAQLKHTYIYDDSGVELHCLKSHNEPQILDFLPYHYLLVSLSKKGFITYQDVSTGQLVKQIRSYTTPMCMKQNPHNAVMHVGNTQGTVSLWTPNSKDPAIKMFCHKGAVTSLAIHRNGVHMATSGTDGRLKLWDLRTFTPVHEYFTYHGATSLDFSQRGLLASGRLNKVEIWKDVYGEKQKEPYMMLNVNGETQDLHFCPFEDILGIGHAKGFESSVVPGSGEPNLDSFEANPYSNSKQRNESEVKKLMEKLRPDMIALDPDSIIKIKQKGKDDATLVDDLEDKLLKDQSTSVEERKEILSEKKIRKQKKLEAFEKQQQKQKEMWSFRDRMEERQKEKKRRMDEQDNKAVPSSQVLDRFKRKKF